MPGPVGGHPDGRSASECVCVWEAIRSVGRPACVASASESQRISIDYCRTKH